MPPCFIHQRPSWTALLDLHLSVPISTTRKPSSATRTLCFLNGHPMDWLCSIILHPSGSDFSKTPLCSSHPSFLKAFTACHGCYNERYSWLDVQDPKFLPSPVSFLSSLPFPHALPSHCFPSLSAPFAGDLWTYCVFCGSSISDLLDQPTLSVRHSPSILFISIVAPTTVYKCPLV